MTIEKNKGNTFGRTHGQSSSRTYRIWIGMVQRCKNPTAHQRKYYSGIKVHPRYVGENGFENFLADMGECPAGKSIDRFPNNAGNYEPGNMRWATQKQQIANRRTY